MEQIILVVHIIAAIGLIGFILIQQGKGAEVGASFGSGASQTLFGSQGSGNFSVRAIAILVTVFFATSLTLGFLASHHSKSKNLDELLKQVESTTQTMNKDKDNDIPRVPAVKEHKHHSEKKVTKSQE